MISVKTNKKIIALFLISIVTFSSVSGIFLANFASQDPSNKSRDYVEYADKENPNLQLDLSKISMSGNETIDGDDTDDPTSNDSNDLKKFTFSTQCKKPYGISNCGEPHIKECENRYIFKAYLLVRQMAKKRGILFYDILNRIKSNPVNINFSDQTTYISEINDLFCRPIPGINVTYYVFNRSNSYPDWIANNPSLSKIYDLIWFYLYFYDSMEFEEYLNRGYVGRWLLSIKDCILNSFWVQKIDTNLTDSNGISMVSQDVYYNPGKYNIITLANIFSTSKGIPPKNFCNFFDIYPYPKCYNPKKDYDFFLFHMFYEHLTVEREITQMELIDYSARYSDKSNFTIQLTDDENFPLLKPYPWNQDNCETNNTVLISDEVEVDYYINLPQSNVYLGTATTDPYGYATLSVPIWIKPDTYNLTVVFEGNICYLPTLVTSEITIEKEFTAFEPIQLYEVNNTDGIILLAQLLDNEGNGIPQLEDLDQEGRFVSFFIEGEWELIGISQTNSEGWCYYTTSFLLPHGIYPFKVEFSGDDYYHPTERFGTIEINREQTILSNLDDVRVQTTDLVILSANLTDNELNPIGNKEICFSICIGWTWHNLGRSLTNEQGLVEFRWIISTAPGTYLIKAEFHQDEYFIASDAFAVATIKKEDTRIIISTIISDSYGKYDVMARLIEDDPDQAPIPDEDITLWINGREHNKTTDENGYGKVSLPINTFNDISIEVEYDGSSFFKSSQGNQVKTFNEEENFFNQYSLDMVIDLFTKFSNLDGNLIPSVANSFFNFKEDALDGTLSTAVDLQQFYSLLGYPYEVVLLGGNQVELQDFCYFVDPISGGDGIVSIFYLGMRIDIPFYPEIFGSPFPGKEYEFSALFEWDEWRERDISYRTLLNYLGCDDMWDLIDLIEDIFGDIWEGDFTIPLNSRSYVEFEIEAVFDIPPWDTDDEEYHWLQLLTHLAQLIKEISIPTDIMEDWIDRRGDLFWKWIEDILKLGFKFMVEDYRNIADNFIELLALLGIDVYEILKDIWGYFNEAKAEKLLSELMEDFDNKLDHVIDKIEAIEFLDYGDEFDALPLGNNIVSSATSLMSISPPQISLDDDFTESELFDEIASQFSMLTGLLCDGDDLEDLFDNLCDTIDKDITLPIPGRDILLDTTEIEEIVSGWDDINKMTFSDISLLNDLIFGLDGIEELTTKDIRDVIILITQTIGGLESIFGTIFEELLEFIAKNDPWFLSRATYEIALLIAMIIHIVLILIDVLDALDKIRVYDIGIFDEILTFILGIVIGYCGYTAKKEVDDNYKEKNAEYVQAIGCYVTVQAYFELDIQIFHGDMAADLGGTVIELILDVISVCSTYWHFYENGDVDWDAILWAVIDGCIIFPDAVFPLVKNYKKALGACIVVCAIGITLLIIRLTNPGRWIG